ncbi:MAG: CoA ester lyase [Alphaproteobacteria bacterium]|jgi:citrate lyase subunit beta/citryl-CoA lyase|nr:CoA ester lyase [Alphaproteobacteria bacterium]
MTRTDLPVWRSLLYVPVNVPRFVAKAHERGADAVQLDIEDSVPAGEKAAARKLIQEAAETVSQAGADVVVRINQPLRLAVPDIEACVSPRVQALALPKTEGPDHVRLLSEMVGELEEERGMAVGQTKFLAMIETAPAFFRMLDIASADPRVVAMSVGGEDFALALGMQPDPETMLYPKQHGLIAARAAGVTPLGIIGTVADYSDRDAYRHMVVKSARFGFEGASCIHPGLVEMLNEGFTPPPDQVDWAERVVAGWAVAEAEGRGSFELDGKMIDVPVVYRAERLLARYQAIQQRNAGG